MSPHSSRLERGTRKRTALASISISLLGSLIAVSWGEGRIADRGFTNGALAAQLAAADALLATAPALETQQVALRRRVRRAAGSWSEGQRVTRFLRDAARSADAHRVGIASLAADGDPVNVALAGRERRSSASGLPFQLSLEGEYREVLAALRELSDLSVPAALDLTSLVRTNPEGPRARLTATLRVVLDDFTTPEFDDARTASI